MKTTGSMIIVCRMVCQTVYFVRGLESLGKTLVGLVFGSKLSLFEMLKLIIVLQILKIKCIYFLKVVVLSKIINKKLFS